MHPIERLRYVARADSIPDRYLVSETMSGLYGFFDDAASLLIALRALISRQPESAALVVMASTLLTALDIDYAAAELLQRLESDPTHDLAEQISLHESAGCVVIDAVASGPTGILCPDGTSAMLKYAAESGRTSAIVTPIGSRLPAGLWASYLERTEGRRNGPFGGESHPWSAFDELIGPGGAGTHQSWEPDCNEAPEISRW